MLIDQAQYREVLELVQADMEVPAGVFLDLCSTQDRQPNPRDKPMRRRSLSSMVESL